MLVVDNAPGAFRAAFRDVEGVIVNGQRVEFHLKYFAGCNVEGRYAFGLVVAFAT